MKTIKKLVKADDEGPIKGTNNKKVTKNKIVTKYKSRQTDPDGRKYASNFKNTAENLGTKKKPIAGYDTMRTKVTNTDPTGKKKTIVTKTDIYGDPRSRKAIIPLKQQKGGIIKRK